MWKFGLKQYKLQRSFWADNDKIISKTKFNNSKECQMVFRAIYIRRRIRIFANCKLFLVYVGVMCVLPFLWCVV